MNTLHFRKMWEAADTYVYDIDSGSIIPILRYLPEVASYADKHFLFYYTDGIGAAYYEEGEMQKAAEAGLRDFTDKKFLEKYFAGIQAILQEQEQFYHAVEDTDLAGVSDTQLKSLFETSVHMLADNFGYYLACQPQCVSLLEKKIEDALQTMLPTETVREVFTLLTTPTERTKMTREEEDWHTLVLAVQRGCTDATREQALLAHYRTYFLLNAADGHEPWTLAYFREKLTKSLAQASETLEKEQQLLAQSRAHTEEEKRACVERYNISETVRDDCNTLAHIGHLRLEMRFLWMPGYYYGKHLAYEVGRRFGVPQELVRFATNAELSSLFDGAKLDQSELALRTKAFLYVIAEGKTQLVGGDTACEMLEAYVPRVDHAGVEELRGSIAMKGVVTAPALVHRWGDDMDEALRSMQGDFILVAGQTRPQLMPLIKKCKGIVTDEGGITSHAAIVSRELKIPCLIGTHTATQVIHTGDMLLLDANEGVVRIISTTHL